MMSPFHLFFWIATGGLSAYLAKKRGKNPYLWFGIGMFLGVLGLFFLLFMPKQKKKVPEPKKEEGVTIDVTPSFKEKFWYYLGEGNAQEGPISFDALKRAFHEGKVSDTTYVWNEEMEEWQHFEKVVTTTQPTS